MEQLQQSEKDLASSGDTHDSANFLSDAAQSKTEHQRLFQRGLKWLGIGICLMALSFGINFFLFDTEVSFKTSMYLLTSVGAACIMKGLVDMLGF